MANFIPYGGLQQINSPIYVGGKLAGNVSAIGKSASDDNIPFKNMLSDAIANVEQLQQVKSEDSYNLSIGDMDDLTAMMVNSQRADTALTMMVEMRNRLLEGYQEIMRVSV